MSASAARGPGGGTARPLQGGMEIQPFWIVVIVGLTVLTLLLTGPGLWSEKWGWKTFERLFRDRRKPPGAGGDRAQR